MNPAAVLALIGDLYAQVAQLQQENAQLRAQVEQDIPPPPFMQQPDA